MPISDTFSIDKQRVQLELLQERREQITMMCRWRKQLTRLLDEQVDLICKELTIGRIGPSDFGVQKIRRWISQFGFENVLSAVNEEFDIRYDGSENGWREAFSRIPKRIKWKELKRQNPEEAKWRYVAGILKNRLRYINWLALEELFGLCKKRNLEVDDVLLLAKKSRYWDQFEKDVRSLLAETSAEQVHASA